MRRAEPGFAPGSEIASGTLRRRLTEAACGPVVLKGKCDEHSPIDMEAERAVILTTWRGKSFDFAFERSQSLAASSIITLGLAFA